MIKFPFGRSKKKKEEKEEKEEKKTKKQTRKKEKTPRSRPEVSGPEKEKAAQVLKSPHVSEKAMRMQDKGKYVFKVNSRANKIEVKKAVQNLYNVKVQSVNIINVPRKSRRVQREEGFKPGYKKAIVTLQQGQTIDELRV